MQLCIYFVPTVMLQGELVPSRLYLPMHTGDGASQLNPPVATSTPRPVQNEKLQGDSNPISVGIRGSALSEATTAAVSNTNTRPSSASSELTEVSTTDIETDDDIDKPIEIQDNHDQYPALTGPSLTMTTAGREAVLVGSSPSPTSVALSDVVVTVGSSAVIGNNILEYARTPSDDQPPPLPSSPPPMFGMLILQVLYRQYYSLLTTVESIYIHLILLDVFHLTIVNLHCT